MKITMFLTEDVLQFNLEGENGVEEEFVKILKKYFPGTVEIHQGVNIMECRAGYVRSFDGDGSSVCAVTIRKAVSAPEEVFPCPQ